MKSDTIKNSIIITESTFKEKIYEIRGIKVMLDSDLASIYGYSTRDFNNQIKNNSERFDEDFMFQLTKEEFKTILRLKFSTANILSSKKIQSICFY